ncbi:unnamed protein product [Sphagnum jensenii]|uniref:Uncharacterized protein n=1 Tax=Sphagnum jensenii TaxID=128206 RepID=A0ABP0X4K0_9BRYO
MRKRKMRRDAGKMEQLRREMGSERGQRIVLQIERVRLEPEALSKQGDFRTGFVATGYCTTHACWQWRVGALAWVVSMEALSIAHQAASTLQILQENAHRLQEAHEMTKNSLFRTNESLSSSLAAMASLERSLAGANEKYLYMQELCDYISVLCEFLQDKGPIIEELQEAMQRLHEEHANALLERHAADNANELTEVEAAVNAAKAAFARGAGTATTTAAAASAVKDGTSTIPKCDMSLDVM